MRHSISMRSGWPLPLEPYPVAGLKSGGAWEIRKPFASFGGVYLERHSSFPVINKTLYQAQVASDDTAGTNVRCKSYSEGLILVQMLSGFGKLTANRFCNFPRGTNLSSYAQ